MTILVKKRDGRTVAFEKEKIANAIRSANDETVLKHNGKGLKSDELEMIIDEIIGSLVNDCNDKKVVKHDCILKIEDIQDTVQDVLMANGYYKVATYYIEYRYKRKLSREFKERDNNILTLINGNNEELSKENSNKNTQLASTQRDYMAGEVSKDLAKRILLPKEVVEAHEKGILHFHDMDYSPTMPIFNCCLINIKDMIDNGTCINGTMVESPKSFPVACTVMTQIIASVASGQYGLK